MTFPPHIATEQIEQLPLADFKGNIVVIDSQGENYRRALETLGKEKVIGFDTETKPCFVAKAPKNRMALLQLSTGDSAFIFRLQQLGLPSELCQLLSNPAIIKVGAAVRDDINGLNTYARFSSVMNSSPA